MPHTTADFIAMFASIDHGIAMQQGFAAVDKALSALDATQASPTDAFNTAAKSFLNAVGASSGPLYATAMMRAGAALKGKTTASDTDVALLIPAMTKGIADRGKAVPGDKTMLDAWQPATDCILALIDQGTPLAQILTKAVAAAEEGAEATIAMEAKLGRSARLGPRSVGHIDAGAASAALIIKALAGSFGANTP